MLSFEVSAIDIILVISVIVLFVLYWTKLSKIDESPIRRSTTHMHTERTSINPRNDYAECPRGFGYIRNIGDNNSVSERCLGCYKIMECYSQREEITHQYNRTWVVKSKEKSNLNFTSARSFVRARILWVIFMFSWFWGCLYMCSAFKRKCLLSLAIQYCCRCKHGK